MLEHQTSFEQICYSPQTHNHGKKRRKYDGVFDA